MLLINKNKIGVERTKFKRADFKENLMRFFESLRHEAADTSV